MQVQLEAVNFGECWSAKLSIGTTQSQGVPYLSVAAYCLAFSRQSKQPVINDSCKYSDKSRSTKQAQSMSDNVHSVQLSQDTWAEALLRLRWASKLNARVSKERNK